MTNLCVSSYSQVIDSKQYNYVGNWYNWSGGRFITNLNIPKVTATTGRDTGAIRYSLTDSSIHTWTGSQWRQVGSGGGGAVSSVFGRTGAVTALAADYNSFFPVLSGTYNNPSWINQLAWSKITGTPTTLSGYGISDAQGALTLTTTGSSGAATLIANTLNIPQYSGGGGGGNTWDSLRVFSVTAYGAKGDSSTNDRYAIQSAVDAAKAAGGGKVLFPSGDYRIDSTIRVDTSNIIFEGYGESSRIIATGDFGNILHFEPRTAKSMANQFTGHQVKDLAVITEVTRTTGAIIYTKYTYRFSIFNCKLGTLVINGSVKEWEGIRHEYQSGFVINNSTIIGRKYGVYVNGEAGSGNISKLHWNGLITNNTLIFGEKIGSGTFISGSYGLYMAGSNGGLQVEQSNISWYENGIRVGNPNGLGTNRELFLGHAFSGDDVGGAGIYIEDSSLNILQITGGWFAGTGRGTQTPTHGVYLTTGTQQTRVNITGGTFYENTGGYGLYMGRGIVKVTGVRADNGIYLGANVTEAYNSGNEAVVTNASAITPVSTGNKGTPESFPGAVSTSVVTVNSSKQVNYDNTSNLTFDNTTFYIKGVSTSAPKLRAGSFEFQTYAVNNAWIAENIYLDGGDFRRRAAGAGGLFYFQGEESQYRLATSSSANSIASLTIPFKLHVDGRVGIGGNMSSTSGTYTGGTLFANSTAVGIGTNGTAPVASAKLEITSTTQGFLPPRMTATQASAISSPAEGLLVYVTDTNGTFTAKGWWGWEGSSWVKLNN